MDYVESHNNKWQRGSDPMHYYQAMLLQMVSSIGGGKKTKVSDFLIDFESVGKGQTTQEHQQIVTQILGI